MVCPSEYLIKALVLTTYFICIAFFIIVVAGILAQVTTRFFPVTEALYRIEDGNAILVSVLSSKCSVFYIEKFRWFYEMLNLSQPLNIP